MSVDEPPAVMREESDEDKNVCFVCMEPNAQRSKCACTDRYVHDDCMMQWLKQKNTNTCPVCKEIYPHVGFQIRTRTRPVYSFWLMILSIILFAGMAAGSVLHLYMYLSPDYVAAGLTLGIGLLLTAISILALFVVCLFGKSVCNNNCKMCERVSQNTVVLQAVSGV